MQSDRNAKTCEVLLAEYQLRGDPALDPVRLKFAGVEDRDVYNITAPFEDEGETIIAGRVEARDSERSHIVFFVEREGQWVPREGMPTLALQDPFYTRIGGEIVLGGVQIDAHPHREDALVWRTVMYKGKRLRELAPFFTGPDGMKDLRLAQLHDGSIGMFTRPQGAKGGRGKIGYARLRSLAELTVEAVEAAPLLMGQFVDAEWGGANEPHLLSNGWVGILGHIACFDAEGNRHYYPMVFALHPFTGEHSDIELIAARSRFLPGASKRADLVDVVFSGGLVRRADGSAELYAGISDAEAHKLTIPDPFLKFERLAPVYRQASVAL